MTVRLEELLAAATPGPWRGEQGGLVVNEDESTVAFHVLERNAALIAKTPDAVRLLIDMGDYLRAQENDLCRDDFYDDTDARSEMLARLDRLGNTT